MESSTMATNQVAVASPALQETSRDLLAQKYLLAGETDQADIFQRVATSLASVEAKEHQHAFQAAFRGAFDAGFVAGGRIMSGAGRDAANVTLINCFVQPIGDCMTGRDEEGLPGIMDALAQAAETMRRGGGVGYNFSRIRPAGAWVKGTQSSASGPCPYIDTFDAMCATVESAGSRRGAQMGVLDVSHPDIEAFVEAKKVQSRWRNFNVSVRTSDAFHAAVEADADWQLVHRAQPHPESHPGASQRQDGLWVYRTIRARELWDRITRMTYDYAEPGIIFGDRVSQENNLWYCESLDATNPCAEQVLPPYGCCCIGSIGLTRFVREPFTAAARFDIDAFERTIATAVRALDNVLDVTAWPLPEQRQEAMNKRRIGLGFFGLGSAMFMLGLRYGSQESVRFTESVSKRLRDAAYEASIELAKEKGPFPLLDREKYLESGFAQRLPDEIREKIRRYGIRNSHLLSIAPTGTMALTFGDNASNGLEPAFSLSYQRRVRQPDGSERIVDVEDHAYRLYRAMGGDVSALPAHWVTAQELSVEEHLRVMAAIVPYIDASISKTVNCPESMSFDAFGDVYRRAYELGLKSCATYRPSGVRGSVLIDPNAAKVIERSDDPDRRLVLKPAAGLTEGSLRWPNRPEAPDGSPSWTFRVDAPEARFAVTVAHYENGINHPFEVWAQGAEVPRVLPAIAKVLSADMRTKDPRWLMEKLHALQKCEGASLILMMPPAATPKRSGSAGAALAHLVEYRATKLGYLSEDTWNAESPMLLAMASRKEPKAEQGSIAWYTDIANPSTGDDFVLMVKEAIMEDGSRFPFSVWAAGTYPRELDGLLKMLSIDMRISDPAWIAMKLKGLLDFPEAKGEFMAPIPGVAEKRQWYSSTVAYIAHILLARYQAINMLNEALEPVRQAGLFMIEAATLPKIEHPTASAGRGHKDCGECGGTRTVVKKDGCEFCAACGHVGSCG